MELRGTIKYITYPKKKDFTFDEDAMFFSFKLKLLNSEEIVKCCGKTFPIFVGADVVLRDVELEESEKYGKTFRFSTLLLNFNKASKNINYCKAIIGVKTYDNLYKYCKKKWDLPKQETEKKARELLIELLESENVEELKKVLNIRHSALALNFINKHKVQKELMPAYEKLGKYGLKPYDVQRFLELEPDVNKVVKTIETNPYKLIKGIGIDFKKADMIFASCGGKTTSKKRIIASIFEALRVGYDKDGNVYLSEKEIQENIYFVLKENYFKEHEDIDAKIIKDCINNLVANNLIILQNNRYYLKENFEIQEFLKDFCKRAIDSKPGHYDVSKFIEKYEKSHNIKLGKEQKQSVHDAVNHKIHIITGGAGVGKTSSLACILSYFLDEIGYKEEEICLVAPTGKAAQRMTESVNKQIGGSHKEIIANTIHSTLKVVVDGSEKLENFQFNSKNKMNCKIVVCDETSMNDYRVSYALLSAIKDDCRVIFLGDIGQLEPVGAGFFFRDAIESGVPTTYLNEIHRQKGESTIISLSQAIRNENFTNSNLNRKIDFSMIELSNNLKTDISNSVKIFMASVKKVGIDQTMLITPLRETDDNNRLDSKTLSIAIQKEYLPDIEDEDVIEKNGFRFKVGSKIIITKNNREKGLINGAIGYITEIVDSTIYADFDGEEKVLFGKDLNHLRLGYAITVHKSQGSDWKNVIYICSKETVMNTKNLVYTAVTRAKDKLVIFGNKDTVEKSQWVHPKRKNSVLLNER